MASKRKPDKKRGPNQIPTTAKHNEDKAVTIARTVLRLTVQAAITLRVYGKSCRDLSLSALTDTLTEQIRASSNGDLKWAEAIIFWP